MAYVKKIYSTYKDCSSSRVFELPAILTETGVLISHLRYLAWHSNKSQSWMERSCFSLMLLLRYMGTSHKITSGTQMLKSFTESLVTGTIDMSTMKDSLELYWRPRKVKDANDILFHITNYTDFLATQDEYQSNLLNPFRKATSYEERLNWCSYYHKQANVFLNHLSNRAAASKQNQLVRMVGRIQDDKVDYEYATRFPESHIDRLIYLGFEKNGVIDYKSQAMTMLMNYGGLRKSEIFQLYTSDITIHPNHNKEALVRVYHPSFGDSPVSGYRNRKEFLLSTTNYKPRNTYLLSERLHAGWKDPLLTSKKGFFEVVFNPPQKAADFLIVWANYLKHQRVEPPLSNPHPFAFTNSTGSPETLKNFQRLHKNAVERIGLQCSHKLGTTEHGHRHAYGFRSREAGLSQVEIQKAMHHKSPMSCLVYIKPTIDEVRKELRKLN